MNRYKQLITILILLICISHTACSNKTDNKSHTDNNVTDSSPTRQINTEITDSLAIQKKELTKIYTQAIADFIKEANKKNKIPFDTLFFGKRKNGQADDFPDIELPETIESVHIRLISPEAGTISQKEHKSRIYINMIGWADKENAEFVIYVFSNGFEHQYNYSINYRYSTKSKHFELDKLLFKGPPFDK